MAAIKVWKTSDDFILSKLCADLVERKLYKVDISNEQPNLQFINQLLETAAKKYNITKQEASYFVFTDNIRNDAYKPDDGNILILMKNGNVKDIAEASDNSNLGALSKTVKKAIICYNKELI